MFAVSVGPQEVPQPSGMMQKPRMLSLYRHSQCGGHKVAPPQASAQRHRGDNGDGDCHNITFHLRAEGSLPATNVFLLDEVTQKCLFESSQAPEQDTSPYFTRPSSTPPPPKKKERKCSGIFIINQVKISYTLAKTSVSLPIFPFVPPLPKFISNRLRRREMLHSHQYTITMYPDCTRVAVVLVFMKPSSQSCGVGYLFLSIIYIACVFAPPPLLLL